MANPKQAIGSKPQELTKTSAQETPAASETTKKDVSTGGTPASGVSSPGTPTPGRPAPGTPASGKPAPGTPAPGTPAPGARKTPGAKEVIPFEWKLMGDANNFVLTLYRAIERSDVEAQMERLLKDNYYKNLRIVANQEKVKQSKAAGSPIPVHKGDPPPSTKKTTKKKKQPVAKKSTVVIVKKKVKVKKTRAAKKSTKTAKPKGKKASKSTKATKSAKTTKSKKVAR